MKFPTACLGAIFALGLATAAGAQTGSASGTSNPNASPTANPEGGGEQGVAPNNSGTGVGPSTVYNGPGPAPGPNQAVSNQPGMMSSASRPGSQSCQDLLNQASSMDKPADHKRLSAANKQLSLANKAEQKGQEKTCVSHARLAIKYMKTA
ncbi:MAG: hypothetical protein JO261_12800 [Alphaproteobacteria bacterium]|nr:hypothetical protein [Alphaproteobacteria bacterium]MBV9694570.1 hypothetical protein [Alphaproteobacteria bacterium]